MVRVVILLFALASGGLAAWLAIAGQASDAPAAIISKPVQQVSFQEVLVADRDIARGSSLDETNIRWQSWPEDAMTAVLISRSSRPDALKDLAGSVVSSGFVAGEPIRDEKLGKPGSGYLAVLLPSGKRAVAVRITAENTAGGFILPNDRVDVVHTTSKPGAGEGDMESVSRTILTNVRVLAVDQTASESDTGTTVVGKTATLEVDPHQVEIVTASEHSGILSLALRAAADDDEKPAVVQENNRTVRVFRAGHTELVQVPKFSG
ncbi:Flp pilus assembly protein CpaB [Mesorhizobium sp. M00.F.Ca.ET.216.01.1.1]|nr:Flp pilus assembly protein CpaB [Mesorhizobium sp. M00.F.Ca.ET.216.01.1.1]TIS55733.1 MAG: Flp pilus assembly protein CpaB [Mesorhizobium sp.]TIS86817.1 MAG: Flp pilus assembly protein CpaB [Mesorhizobium sp.]TJW04607.1 MAG: Flp pilus assembly protein CpaB [Mesorhizobium sp.]TJW47945.1 MAG: Flp pilus assembly protein CpaB [Mesorhizobium sp.]